MCRTPAAAAAPSAVAPRPGRADIRIAACSGGGARSRDLVEEAGEVAREVVEVAAGGDDVDEAEERGAQLGVLRGEVHRPVVERAQRLGPGRGQGGRQLARRRRGRPARDAGAARRYPPSARVTRAARGDAKSRHADRRRRRRAHRRRRRRRRRAARPRPRAARRTARWRPERARRLGLVRRGGGARRRRGPGRPGRRAAAGPGTGASIAANKVAGRPRRALRRRGDGRRRAALERRQRARPQPARRPRAPSWRRSSTPGSPPAPSDDAGDAANVAHLDAIR